MRNLVVDIGNTQVKIAVVDGDDVVSRDHFDALDDVALGAVESLVRQHSIRRAIISSTRADGEAVCAELCGVVEDVLLFGANTPIPIECSYSTPHTLGRDRLAAAVGAVGLYDADRYVVVDVGSALTIDLVTRGGGFEGGVISPGIAMRFRALHQFTASLPLCEPTDKEVEVARTTQDAIEQGVMEGIAYEIEGHIDKFWKKGEKNVTIFTGGGAKLLINRIKKPIFANRELVIVGLNRILEYNAK